jgi:hypothetical protein
VEKRPDFLAFETDHSVMTDDCDSCEVGWRDESRMITRGLGAERPTKADQPRIKGPRFQADSVTLSAHYSD